MKVESKKTAAFQVSREFTLTKTREGVLLHIVPARGKKLRGPANVL